MATMPDERPSLGVVAFLLLLLTPLVAAAGSWSPLRPDVVMELPPLGEESSSVLELPLPPVVVPAAWVGFFLWSAEVAGGGVEDVAGEFGGEDEEDSCFGESGSEPPPSNCSTNPGPPGVFCGEDVTGSGAGSGSFFSGAGAGGGEEGASIEGGFAGAAAGAGAGVGAAGTDAGEEGSPFLLVGMSPPKISRLSTAAAAATSFDVLMSSRRCDKDLACATGVSERRERRSRVPSVEQVSAFSEMYIMYVCLG